ncbi:MAG: glycosyltransferase family 61 protein [Leptolyngbya sp. SIO1D8]|nr:glycosyltransferase family 61 protein [Leptolyngbya sp. SIO1D8]
MGSAAAPTRQSTGSIANFVKPLVRPWYNRFLLDPTVKLLLSQTTVDKEYGSDHIKRCLPTETVATPETKGMPEFDKPFAYLQGDTYTTHDIYSAIVEDVLYEPGNGAVITQSRKIFSESLYPNMDPMTIAGGFLNRNFIRRKLFNQPVEKISGYSSVYQGLPNGYYHKIIDLVPRCFLLNHPDYAQLDEIKLLYAEPLAEVEELMVPKLVPGNVRRVRLEPGRLYHLEKLILPTFLTQFGSGYLPASYIQKLRETFLPKRPSKRCNRIYISRQKSVNSLKKRHILNEPELFSGLQKFGFKRYFLEDYSLPEKIELFYDAETVVGAYGGGLTHILFSENVNLIELQLMKKMQTYYYYIAKALGHNFEFVCADKANNRENFSVDISRVTEILKRWC